MFTDMHGTEKSGDSRLPGGAGFTTEAARSMQWVLNQLASILSFIPNLSSQRQFPMSSGQSLPAFQHLDWIQRFMANIMLLPASISLLFSASTNPLFLRPSFVWFDRRWLRHRDINAIIGQENEGKIHEDFTRYTDETITSTVLSLLEQGQYFTEPFYAEDKNATTGEPAETSSIFSDFTHKLPLPLKMSGFPLLRHQPKYMIPSQLKYLIPLNLFSTDQISAEAIQQLLSESNLPLQPDFHSLESLQFESMHNKLNYLESHPTYQFSDRITLHSTSKPQARYLSSDITKPHISEYIEELLHLFIGKQAKGNHEYFISPLHELAASTIQQAGGLPVGNSLTKRVKWLPAQTELSSVSKFQSPIIEETIIAPRHESLPDRRRSVSPEFETVAAAPAPGLPPASEAIPTPPLRERQPNSEKTTISNRIDMPAIFFDFPLTSYGTYQIVDEMFKTRKVDNPLISALPQDTADMALKALTNGHQVGNAGYYGTRDIELALAPIGRQSRAGENTAAASPDERSREDRPQDEETQSPDYEALAAEVYSIIKKRLFIEKERAQGLS